MKVIISAGATYEPLDEVRRLTNFSTGALGTELASYLLKKGHEVILFRSETSTAPQPIAGVSVVPFTTTQSLLDTFTQQKTEDSVAVFHAAAVSDFYFGRVCLKSKNDELIPFRSGKYTTHSGERLWAELLPTPKILSQLRFLYPNAFITGWKYEIDGDRAQVIAKAQNQLMECKSNLCVMNGKAYGKGFGILSAEGKRNLAIPGRQELFEAICGFLK